jgi:hypothetical protein
MVLLKLTTAAEEQLRALLATLPTELQTQVADFLRTETSCRALDHEVVLSVTKTVQPDGPPVSFASLVQGAQAFIPLQSQKVRFASNESNTVHYGGNSPRNTSK